MLNVRDINITCANAGNAHLLTSLLDQRLNLVELASGADKD